MPTFSERMGLAPARDTFQLDSMDLRLRTRIWNHLTDTIFSKIEELSIYVVHDPEFLKLAHLIWSEVFISPLSKIPEHPSDTLKEIEKYVLSSATWDEVYSFIEFLAPAFDDFGLKDRINNALEKEKSGYRLINKTITPIVNESEIEAIESAISVSRQGPKQHLSQALTHLSDRDAPDYRNSIKESISAVEAFVVSLSPDDKGTLGKLIAGLQKEGQIHPALASAFQKLYGYTSDESGIRHAIMDDAVVEEPEARFMLVACSAFVNYLTAKSMQT